MRPIVSSAKWDASPLPQERRAWDTSHMAVIEIRENIRRRMRALGLTMKGLSLAAGVGETYVRDLLKGRSGNPKTEQSQKVLDYLDRLEAEAATAATAPKKGHA